MIHAVQLPCGESRVESYVELRVNDVTFEVRRWFRVDL